LIFLTIDLLLLKETHAYITVKKWE